MMHVGAGRPPAVFVSSHKARLPAAEPTLLRRGPGDPGGGGSWETPGGFLGDPGEGAGRPPGGARETPREGPMRPQGGARETPREGPGRPWGGFLGDPAEGPVRPWGGGWETPSRPCPPPPGFSQPAGPVRLLVSATCVVSGAGTPAGKQGGQRAGTRPLGKGGPSQVPGWSAAPPGSGRGASQRAGGGSRKGVAARAPVPLQYPRERAGHLGEEQAVAVCPPSFSLSPASLAPEPWAP